MKKINISLLATLFTISASNLSAKMYRIDVNKSSVTWVGKKIAIANNGSIQIKKGKVKISKKRIKGKIIINMRSIKVLNILDPKYNLKLTNHLNSEDFFHTAKYPSAILKFKNVIKRKNDYLCQGTLTIKGITKPIEFPVKFEIKNQSLTASGKLTVDRTQYNIRYGSGKFFEGLGDNLIHDNFEVDFEIVSK